MRTTYSYACKDYSGMETCPGRYFADNQEELWRHMELHASIAHGEHPTKWSAEDWAYLKGLVRNEMIEDSTGKRNMGWVRLTFCLTGKVAD